MHKPLFILSFSLSLLFMTELGRGWSDKHAICGNGWASSEHDSGASVGSPQHGRSALQPTDLFEVAIAINPAIIYGHVRGGASYKPEKKVIIFIL